MLAYLQSSYQTWFTSALWGLIGSALIAVIVAAFEIWRRLPKPTPEVTPENVEANIRAWLDSFRLSVKREDNPIALFTLVATPDNGMPIVIWRPKALDRYVIVEATITISPEDKPLFDNLPAEEKGIFATRLSVELSRASMGFVMDLDKSNVIGLQRRLPITADLTESNLMTTVDEVGNARLRALRTLTLMLFDIKKQQTNSAPPSDST